MLLRQIGYVILLYNREYMQVHLKHLDGHIEEVSHLLVSHSTSLSSAKIISSLPNLKQVPYFCLPANDLVDVIAPSCYRYDQPTV